ncbi:MAG: hypothetical protein H6985_02340 [Pseudomonadales bacterium]|nr:hypothetical protein [Pseudomonadales bacterium]
MAGRVACARTRVLVGASLLLWLVGCSGTTFVYNRLDSILPWYVDDYVELNGHQERQLDQALQPFLRWHRQQELPRYLDLLNKVEASLDQPVTPGEVRSLYEGMEIAWLRLEQESLEWLLALGDTLSEAQVQEFLGYLQEKQEEYEEEYLGRSEPEYREESYDSFADTLEDYLGRLTPAQRERLLLASAALQRSDAIWLKERAAWQERLVVLMQRQLGWKERVRESIARRSETVSPEYVQVFEHNLNVVFAAISDVLNMRTEKQDRHLRRELDDLREDLQTLIAEDADAPAESA